jgi:hypothetical protein
LRPADRLRPGVPVRCQYRNDDHDERSKQSHVYLPVHDNGVAVGTLALALAQTNGVTVLLP